MPQVGSGSGRLQDDAFGGASGASGTLAEARLRHLEVMLATFGNDDSVDDVDQFTIDFN